MYNKGIEQMQSELLNEAMKLKQNVWPKPFWYEVRIDYYERFETEVYPIVKNMPKQNAAKYVLNYLIEREKFYSSPKYYEMLDRLVASADFQPV